MEKLLLPFRYKMVGFVSIAFAILLSVLYFFFNFRFSMPVFAIYSAFLETKVFAVFSTNFADELILLLFLLGLFLLVFTEERVEHPDFGKMRSKAFEKSIQYYFLSVLASILFFYGSGFITILILDIYLPFIIYLIFFYKLKIKERKQDITK